MTKSNNFEISIFYPYVCVIDEFFKVPVTVCPKAGTETVTGYSSMNMRKSQPNRENKVIAWEYPIE